MHEHQLEIIRKISLLGTARYNDLRNYDLDPKQVAYHIKKLVEEGILFKDDEGNYSLTPKGKNELSKYKYDPIELYQPGISLLLHVTNSAGEILAVRRTSEPFLDYVGHPSGRIKLTELAVEAGSRLAEEIGLQVELSLAGILDYIYPREKIEEVYRNVMFIFAGEYAGDAELQTDEGELFWASADELVKGTKIFQNTADIINIADAYRETKAVQVRSNRYQTTL